VAEDSVDDYPLEKSPSLGAAGSVSKTPKWILSLFSIYLRSFMPDELLLACRFDRKN